MTVRDWIHWLYEPTSHHHRRWHLAVVYIIVVVTLTFLVQVFGVPFVDGR